ncbi:hypothetical protein [Archaeoglobus sp.]
MSLNQEDAVIVRKACWICKYLEYGVECDCNSNSYRCFFECEYGGEIFGSDVFTEWCDKFELRDELRWMGNDMPRT